MREQRGIQRGPSGAKIPSSVIVFEKWLPETIKIDLEHIPQNQETQAREHS
jgi:hypothetical protein